MNFVQGNTFSIVSKRLKPPLKTALPEACAPGPRQVDPASLEISLTDQAYRAKTY